MDLLLTVHHCLRSNMIEPNTTEKVVIKRRRAKKYISPFSNWSLRNQIQERVNKEAWAEWAQREVRNDLPPYEPVEVKKVSHGLLREIMSVVLP